MARNPIPKGSSDNIGRIVVLVVLAIGVSAFGTVAWVSCTSDSDGDGVRDCFEIATGEDPLGGGGEGDKDGGGLCGDKAFCAMIQPTTTPPPVTSKPPVTTSSPTSPPSTTSSPTSPPTTKPPYTSPPPVTSKPPTTTAAPPTTAPATTAPATTAPQQGTISISSELQMNTLYASGHPLEPKIYLLKPGDTIHETVTFRVIGAPVEDVAIDFVLLQGGLTLSIAKHEVAGPTISQPTRYFGTLQVGEHTEELTGVVPDFTPGRDWYEGLVVIRGNGIEQTRLVNRRVDESLRIKWLTLAYGDTWSNIPFGEAVQSVYAQKKEGAGVILYFNTFNPLGLGLSAIEVYQLSYPGKWKQVYKGATSTCSSAQTQVLPCWLDSSQSSVFIPFDNFARAAESESYLKVSANDSLGLQIDLNAASNDMAARINLPFTIDGGYWSGNDEYFSVFGASGRRPFSVFGGGGHPEAQWFKEN